MTAYHKNKAINPIVRPPLSAEDREAIAVMRIQQRGHPIPGVINAIGTVSAFAGAKVPGAATIRGGAFSPLQTSAGGKFK